MTPFEDEQDWYLMADITTRVFLLPSTMVTLPPRRPRVSSLPLSPLKHRNVKKTRTKANSAMMGLRKQVLRQKLDVLLHPRDPTPEPSPEPALPLQESMWVHIDDVPDPEAPVPMQEDVPIVVDLALVPPAKPP